MQYRRIAECMPWPGLDYILGGAQNTVINLPRYLTKKRLVAPCSMFFRKEVVFNFSTFICSIINQLCVLFLGN